MCLDLLLPAFCQAIIYPIANEGSDMVIYLMMYSIYTMKYNSYINLKSKCKTLLEFVHSKGDGDYKCDISRMWVL